MLKGWALPALVHQTSHGGLLYCTPDLAQELSGGARFLAQVDVADLLHKPFAHAPLAQLLSAPPNQLGLYSCRSNAGGTSTSAVGLTVDGAAGRKTVTVEDYARRLALDRPPLALALADEPPLDSSSKRARLAATRSLEWFASLRQLQRLSEHGDWSNTQLLGVLPGCMVK